MYGKYDIFIAYKESKSRVTGKGYRVPKDWDKYWDEKLSIGEKQNITNLSNYLISIWQNIDLDAYMDAGFKTYKTFDFKKLLCPKVIDTYIRRDKTKKRDIVLNGDILLENMEYVRSLIDIEDNSDMIREYCKDKNRVLDDYMNNRIDGGFLFWLIYDRYLHINELDKNMISYIHNNWNELKRDLAKLRNIIKRIV